MAKKSLGHVELQWTCPNCTTVNPGPIKVCEGCGAPQPKDVKFEQADRQELITDKEKLAKIKAGADIHCAYCGTRNPAGATLCSQCKADISEGTKRETGRVVGKFKTGPATQVACPHCGADNPDTAKRCSQCGGSMARSKVEKRAREAKPKSNNSALIIIGAVLLLGCAAVYFFFIRTTRITGVVQSVRWERSISIEEYGPNEHEDWYSDVPFDAEDLFCSPEVREVVDSYVAGAEEVCGEPYTVNDGTGFGQVVQDCEYHVYEDKCTYTIVEWHVGDPVSLSGSGFSAEWPDTSTLTYDQELGNETTETYTVVFDAAGKRYTYTTEDYDEFLKCEIGSTWTLNVTTAGGVSSVE